jgi:ribosomal protein S12 methylthiotransferase accessory factor
MAYWLAEYAIDQGKYEWAGGGSVDDQYLAFTKVLAESVERSIWFTYSNYSYLSATIVDIEKKENFLHPKNFASYNDLQRKEHPRLEIKPSDPFRWVRGYSWTKEASSWIPAQIISGQKDFRAFSFSSKEPAIRASITTGLATHPIRTSALLAGALEIIERDAYMITWLNQLSLPRIDLTELSSRNESLSKLLKVCRRYQFQPHAIRLLTDAPTHAICVMLEDLSEALPRFSVGLKAHQNPAIAVEGAILEALRMHQTTRKKKLFAKNDWDPRTKAADITHYNRLMYWSEEGRSDRLKFMINGDISLLKKEDWDEDSDEEHFRRIVNWCKEKNYELASVNLNAAPANIPKWNIEFVVIPELQPIYFNEKLPQIGGKRLQDVPKQFGYHSRNPYYNDDPHPFV